MLTLIAVVLLLAVIGYFVWKKLTSPVSSVLGLVTGTVGGLLGAVKKLLPGRK